MNTWRIENNRIILNFKNFDFWWSIPSDFKMPHISLLKLVEWLLSSPFGYEIIDYTIPRKYGCNNAVSYSGGVDSTAVLQLVENPIPIHYEVANPGKLHKTINGVLATKKHSNGVVVTGNANEFGKNFGNGKVGFWCLGGFTIPSILYADYLDIGTISTGDIFGNFNGGVYMDSIYTNKIISNETRIHVDLVLNKFRHAGLYLTLPAIGMTEIVTTKIFKKCNIDKNYIMGCMRGEENTPCMNCFKCYRKSAIDGNIIDLNPETENNLSRNPILRLHELLWCVKNNGLKHPLLESLINRKDKNIDWVDKWYSASIEFIPEHMRDYFLTKLKEFEIETMTNDDIQKLTEWNSFL
jgi:hypothetical protein